MFIITKGWLKKHRTKAGGYCNAQFAILGVMWPPAKGWKSHVLGRPLEEGLKLAFESYAAKYDKPSNKRSDLLKKLKDEYEELKKESGRLKRQIVRMSAATDDA